MGFNNNPYKHVELLRVGEYAWIWYCNSCGGRGKSPMIIDLVALIDDFRQHLKTSHNANPEDYEAWTDL